MMHLYESNLIPSYQRLHPHLFLILLLLAITTATSKNDLQVRNHHVKIAAKVPVAPPDQTRIEFLNPHETESDSNANVVQFPYLTECAFPSPESDWRISFYPGLDGGWHTGHLKRRNWWSSSSKSRADLESLSSVRSVFELKIRWEPCNLYPTKESVSKFARSERYTWAI